MTPEQARGRRIWALSRSIYESKSALFDAQDLADQIDDPVLRRCLQEARDSLEAADNRAIAIQLEMKSK